MRANFNTEQANNEITRLSLENYRLKVSVRFYKILSFAVFVIVIIFTINIFFMFN